MFRYPNSSELASSTTGSNVTSFGYDNNGNRISESGATNAQLTFDGADRMTGYSNATTGVSASYTYNGDGLRASVTSGGVVSQMAWHNGSVPQLLSDSTNDYIYGADGLVIEQVNEATNAATYLYSDQLGSVVMEADQSGGVLGTQTYSDYGTLASSTGNDNTPVAYAGGYTDTTGLIYLVNRYYDPQTGQFMSVDPIVSSTRQPYSYAAESPTNYADPKGLSVVINPNNTACGLDPNSVACQESVQANQEILCGLPCEDPNAGDWSTGAVLSVLGLGACYVADIAFTGATATGVCIAATTAAFGYRSYQRWKCTGTQSISADGEDLVTTYIFFAIDLPAGASGESKVVQASNSGIRITKIVKKSSLSAQTYSSVTSGSSGSCQCR